MAKGEDHGNYKPVPGNGQEKIPVAQLYENERRPAVFAPGHHRLLRILAGEAPYPSSIAVGFDAFPPKKITDIEISGMQNLTFIRERFSIDPLETTPSVEELLDRIEQERSASHAVSR